MTNFGPNYNHSASEIITRAGLDFPGYDTSGIYFLVNAGKIVYVGQSKRIFRRIRDHREEGAKEFTAFSFIDIEYEKWQIEHVEAFYIWKFEPIYNRAVPVAPKFTYTKEAFIPEVYIPDPAKGMRWAGIRRQPPFSWMEYRSLWETKSEVA